MTLADTKPKGQASTKPLTSKPVVFRFRRTAGESFFFAGI